MTELTDFNIKKHIKKLRDDVRRTQIVTIILTAIVVILSMLVIQG